VFNEYKYHDKHGAVGEEMLSSIPYEHQGAKREEAFVGFLYKRQTGDANISDSRLQFNGLMREAENPIKPCAKLKSKSCGNDCRYWSSCLEHEHYDQAEFVLQV